MDNLNSPDGCPGKFRSALLKHKVQRPPRCPPPAWALTRAPHAHAAHRRETCRFLCAVWADRQGHEAEALVAARDQADKPDEQESLLRKVTKEINGKDNNKEQQLQMLDGTKSDS